MIKCFPIEMVRIAIEQTLLKEHIANDDYFGGKSQMKFTSFYEQLKSQEEVDRFVEIFSELVDQQNRTDLIGNGVITSPENPSLTNLYSCLIVPMTWACSIRCKLKNRDQMLQTLFHLIEELKGSKVDVAQLKCRDEFGDGEAVYIPFAVGTIGHNEGKPKISSGDYIGTFDSEEPTNQQFIDKINSITAKNIEGVEEDDYFYFGTPTKIKVVVAKNSAASIDLSVDTQEMVVDDSGNISANLLLVSDEYFDEIPSSLTVSAELSVNDGNTTISGTFNGVINDTYLSNGNLYISASFSNIANTSSFTPATINVVGSVSVTDYRIVGVGWICTATFTSLNDFTQDELPSSVEFSYDIDFSARNILTSQTETHNVSYTSTFTPTLVNNKLTVSTTIATEFDNMYVDLDETINSQSVSYVAFTNLVLSVDSVSANGIYINQFDIVSDESEYPNIIFPYKHEDYEKYKVSLSFDNIRCDEPRSLNGEEYCELSFGGSATIVNASVKLGNDLVKVSIQKNKILADAPIVFENAPIYYIEPLELPSGNGANTIPSQIASNFLKVNTHTDSITLRLQYTFILDESVDIIKQWFHYARYGTSGTDVASISPNMIYNIVEYWSSWGEVENCETITKIVESIEIENTESDTLTISIPMQIQGENN